jgi:glycosyltransferase involved in cell wall biosynthesis
VTPIISIAYISRALKNKGYVSHTVVLAESSIYKRDDFDFVLVPKRVYPKLFRLIFGNSLVYFFFMRSLWSYDIFHYYFDGGILRQTLLSRAELFILKLCRKKIVLLPYGSDAFVYDLIPNPIWRHALMQEYSQFGNSVNEIQCRIRRMTASADIVIACLVHFINLPRWDILPLTCYPVDTDKLQPVYPVENQDKQVRIAHASNHRGVKGTIFLIEAVHRLNQEGFNVSLDVIEKAPNSEALLRIQQCDIYVDQLIFGYAQAALEGLAFGKVVISALDDTENQLFRRFSYLKECPIVSANTDTIYDVLKSLILKQQDWNTLGRLSREFVVKRHSFEACSIMYEAIYQRIWWEDSTVDLINLYNPVMEKIQ